MKSFNIRDLFENYEEMTHAPFLVIRYGNERKKSIEGRTNCNNLFYFKVSESYFNKLSKESLGYILKHDKSYN